MEEENKLSVQPCLISLKDVMTMTGKKRSTIWRDIKAGTFPCPLKIGRRTIAFKLTEINQWINSRPRIQI